MSKSEYSITFITKQDCKSLLQNHHYLNGISRGFKSGYNFGLMYKDKVVGVCIYTGLPVPELATSMFGLDRKNQEGLFELSRLCIHPDIQKNEVNITSWFVSRTIKLLKKTTEVRAILSYADDDYHKGIIYQACNFKYYGLTHPKKDFFIKQPDGNFIKHSRGKVKGLDGEWRDRSRKHRYLITLDKKLVVKWKEECYPKVIRS